MDWQQKMYFFYDVYSWIAKLDLQGIGIETKYEEIEINLDDKEWEGLSDKYWCLKYYYLPICTVMNK